MFKPGHQKIGGRKKGSVNKTKIIRIADYLSENNINLAKEIYENIQKISEPSLKHRALLDYYKFVDAPIKEKTEVSSDEEQQEEQSADILSIIK